MVQIHNTCLLLILFWRFLASHVAPTYFPERVFGEESDTQDYAQYLTAMEEPPLWVLFQKRTEVTVFRLFWLPSFHPATSMRIVKKKDTYVLHVVQLKYKGDVPGKIMVRKSKRLTESQWNGLQARVISSDFWQMKPPKKEPNFLGVLDGDHLVVEGVESGKYHAVDRNLHEAAYENLCYYMLELSDLDFKKAWNDYHDAPENAKPEE